MSETDKLYLIGGEQWAIDGVTGEEIPVISLPNGGFTLLLGKKFDHRPCLPMTAVRNGAVIPDGWKLDLHRRAYFIDGGSSAKAEGGKE